MPCSPTCVASQLRRHSPDPVPPPLLPRPPSTKSRPFANSSSTSSDLSESSSKLLIELEGDMQSSNEQLKNNFFSIPANIPDGNFNDIITKYSNLKSTNPFYQSPVSVPYQNDLSPSIYKSSSGPNVRNMVNMWQSPPPISENHSLSSSADKLKSTSVVSSYKSQLLSRTVSTPPACSSIYSDHPSMKVLKSASKVSTNPFIVADHQNNNSQENVNSSNSSWESFH